MQLISRACWWMSAADSKRCFQQRRYVSLQIWGRALWVKQRIWKASLSPFFCPIFRSVKDEVRLNLSHIRGRIFAKEPSNSSAVSLKQFFLKNDFYYQLLFESMSGERTAQTSVHRLWALFRPFPHPSCWPARTSQPSNHCLIDLLEQP